MGYLEIIERLEKTPKDPRGAPASAECRHEINEINEKSSDPDTDLPPAALSRMAPCARQGRAGCYVVFGPDGMALRVRPKRAAVDWEEWLRRWRPRGGHKQ